MICTEYDGLEPMEKSIFIGKIVHAVQNDSELFKAGLKLIVEATEKGVFDKVVFLPNHQNDNNEPATN